MRVAVNAALGAAGCEVHGPALVAHGPRQPLDLRESQPGAHPGASAGYSADQPVDDHIALAGRDRVGPLDSEHRITGLCHGVAFLALVAPWSLTCSLAGAFGPVARVEHEESLCASPGTVGDRGAGRDQDDLTGPAPDRLLARLDDELTLDHVEDLVVAQRPVGQYGLAGKAGEAAAQAGRRRSGDHAPQFHPRHAVEL